jgi:hypothetical protein
MPSAFHGARDPQGDETTALEMVVYGVQLRDYYGSFGAPHSAHTVPQITGEGYSLHAIIRV